MMKPLRRNDSSFENAPEGTHTAIITTVADLGLQSSKYDPEGKEQIGIVYELTDETRSDGSRMAVWETYNAVINEKSKLFGVAAAALRKVPEPFNQPDLLGKVAAVTIVHRQDAQGRTWANVESVGALPPAAKKDVTTDTPLQVFDLDDPDPAVYQKLPRLFKKKIEERIRREAVDEGPAEKPEKLPW
jgi:hypothetical protein